MVQFDTMVSKSKGLVPSITPHLCALILMITTIEMKEDILAFIWKKDQWMCTIFEKMPMLTRLMKDVWLGNTLYIH